MKKTFRLQVAGSDDARALESIKTEIRKYVKRERRKTVPEGFDYWDFDCKVGADPTVATIKQVKEVTDAVDEVVKAGGREIYVEILATPRRAATAVDTDPLELKATPPAGLAVTDPGTLPDSTA